jgi:SAM-dependent methyltransferase
MIATEPATAKPAYYDDLYLKLARRKADDIDGVLAFAGRRPSGRVLDLGGGFGRLARVLARAGHDVTVVDREQAMLSAGARDARLDDEAIAARIAWLHADIARPLDDLPLNWYALAICAHHTINELCESEQLNQLFANLRAHLETDGIALIDAIADVPYPRLDVVEWLDAFADSERTSWIVTTVATETAPRRHRLLFFYEQYEDGRMSERFVRSLERRVWTSDEIAAAAAGAGFVAAEPRDGAPFTFVKT